MSFLQEAVRAPHVTGAIAPSSRHLARVIVEKAEVAKADRIIELGPGTGVFTETILEEKKPAARFVALEYSKVFAEMIKAKYPDVHVIEGCASKLRDHAASGNCEDVCSIVSGLPWAIFSESSQRGILHEIKAVLGNHGVFATFAYFGPHWLPAGQRFRKLLRSEFPSVKTSPVVMRNFPPAFVYYCSK